jgi:hypothetical protein
MYFLFTSKLVDMYEAAYNCVYITPPAGILFVSLMMLDALLTCLTTYDE